MTPTELLNTIRAEVERHLSRADRRTDKEHASHNAEMEKFGEDYWNGYGDLAYALLSFLDTITEQPAREGLEEAAGAHIRRVADAVRHRGWDLETQDIAKAFIAGAEWQKAKMLDGAVEGMVCATITGTNAISFLSPLPDELNAGDKVRVIVIKEDEK